MRVSSQGVKKCSWRKFSLSLHFFTENSRLKSKFIMWCEEKAEFLLVRNPHYKTFLSMWGDIIHSLFPTKKDRPEYGLKLYGL